jgi:hypothetical protein
MGKKSKKNTSKNKSKNQSTNNILKEYYEWEGEQLWNKLNKQKHLVNRILNSITEKYNKKNQEIELIKTDTGIIVIVLKNIVIKIYTEKKYEKIRDIIGSNHPNIEREKKSIKLKDIYFVISHKIIPILIDFKINPILNSDKIKGDIENLRIQINKALDEIDELGFIHGDTRLDNIGVEIKDNKYNYILFDFGATVNKNESLRSTDYDRMDLDNSIKLYL